jgi:hypothetical protein
MSDDGETRVALIFTLQVLADRGEINLNRDTKPFKKLAVAYTAEFEKLRALEATVQLVSKRSPFVTESPYPAEKMTSFLALTTYCLPAEKISTAVAVTLPSSAGSRIARLTCAPTANVQFSR